MSKRTKTTDTPRLDDLLSDEHARAYLMERLKPAIVQQLTKPDDDPLDNDDLVSIRIYEHESGAHVDHVLRIDQLPWRIAVVLRRLWTPTNRCIHDRVDDDVPSNFDPGDNILVNTYIECLETTAFQECIPVWDDPDEHDVSEFAQPGTVLYDAYVYHAVNNKDAVVEKMVTSYEILITIARENGLQTQVASRWARNPRAMLRVVCS